MILLSIEIKLCKSKNDVEMLIFFFFKFLLYNYNDLDLTKREVLVGFATLNNIIKQHN